MKSTFFLILLIISSTSFCADGDSGPSRFRDESAPTDKKPSRRDTEDKIERFNDRQMRLLSFLCSAFTSRSSTEESIPSEDELLAKRLSLFKKFKKGYQRQSVSAFLDNADEEATITFLQGTTPEYDRNCITVKLIDRLETAHMGSILPKDDLQKYIHAATSGEFDEYGPDRNRYLRSDVDYAAMDQAIEDSKSMRALFARWPDDQVLSWLTYREMRNNPPIKLTSGQQNTLKLVCALLSPNRQQSLDLFTDFIQKYPCTIKSTIDPETGATTFSIKPGTSQTPVTDPTPTDSSDAKTSAPQDEMLTN